MLQRVCVTRGCRRRRRPGQGSRSCAAKPSSKAARSSAVRRRHRELDPAVAADAGRVVQVFGCIADGGHLKEQVVRSDVRIDHGTSVAPPAHLHQRLLAAAVSRRVRLQHLEHHASAPADSHHTPAVARSHGRVQQLTDRHRPSGRPLRGSTWSDGSTTPRSGGPSAPDRWLPGFSLVTGIEVIASAGSVEPWIPPEPSGTWSLGAISLGPDNQAADILTRAYTAEEVRARHRSTRRRPALRHARRPRLSADGHRTAGHLGGVPQRPLPWPIEPLGLAPGSDSRSRPAADGCEIVAVPDPLHELAMTSAPSS